MNIKAFIFLIKYEKEYPIQSHDSIQCIRLKSLKEIWFKTN